MIAALVQEAIEPFSVSDVLVESVVVLFLLIPISLSIWAFLDAVHRPRWVWAMSDRRQLVWLVMIIMGVITMILGIIVSVFYLVMVRRELRSIENGNMDLFTSPG